MPTHVGRIVLTVNGVPRAEFKSIKPRTSTGRKAITGMSPSGGQIGWVGGTPEHTLDGEAYIPVVGEVDWDNLTDAFITISPRDGIGPTTLYMGVTCTENSVSYGEKDEATRSVSLFALRKVEI